MDDGKIYKLIEKSQDFFENKVRELIREVNQKNYGVIQAISKIKTLEGFNLGIGQSIFKEIKDKHQLYFRSINTGHNIDVEISPDNNELIFSSWSKYTKITNTYNVLQRDFTIDAYGGSYDINLPSSVGLCGKIYVIKNSGDGNKTINAFFIYLLI